VRSDHIAVVPNPVDLDAVRERARESIDPAHERAWQGPVIVAAGRLAEAKNYPLLIDAMAVLRRSLDARLFILGTGDEEEAIRARIRERGLEYAVTLCGFQKNPWKYIARADVFALTSHYEGFGNVLIEAMACGVPVVATVSAGTRDIVHDGVDGILVERHQPEAFAGALAAVLGDPQRRRLMAAAASESAPRFALPRIAQIYDDTFQGVMA
jgi:glycosyltransferase involved in cell wall biosynthesis